MYVTPATVPTKHISAASVLIFFSVTVHTSEQHETTGLTQY